MGKTSVQLALDQFEIFPPFVDQPHQLFGLAGMIFGNSGQQHDFLPDEGQVFRAGRPALRVGVQRPPALYDAVISLLGRHEGILPCLC